MSFNELQAWIIPIAWSLAAVGVGLICGFFAGRTFALSNEPRRLKRDRARTMEALMTVINSTNQLNSDVTDHNTALQNAESEIQQCESSAQVVDMQDSLVHNIRKIVAANQKMENDLVVSKFQLEETAQELDRSRKEARTDALCKVANRKAVDETLTFMVSRFRSQKKSFGLMLIDIDHFKRINDTFGHDAGDEVLISVGKALKECVRPEDFVGRLGGDEFVLMLEGLTEANAELVGKRIRSTIELYNFSVGSRGQSTVVTLSMGLAVIKLSDDAKSLYRRADQALYRSKELGRNQLFTIVENSNQPPNPQPASSPVATYEQFKATLDGDL
ncbi:GGDEF domain-containing protein [Mariniblastus fucicola]|uniref:diguanylate cyclase n=1 Tax=Mariniblastus fucicola TaxID=980251 RepID=A0A5B9PCV9_9BACT|nr:GGDEF domain-containing protein [Mariniblastus fucicola]QEG22742.1 Diguanylate cyclase DosC [Mariniblastus fucicola]